LNYPNQGIYTSGSMIAARVNSTDNTKRSQSTILRVFPFVTMAQQRIIADKKQRKKTSRKSIGISGALGFQAPRYHAEREMGC
jgi:hypothetical protein